jgi:N-acetylglucosaminyl-diphospho-decaprenol L-rhamnosyltransferase
MSSPRIHCIVVNYRTPALAVECLASLAAERQRGVRLDATVVDNASGDGSIELISAAIARAGWGEWAALRASLRNGGFAAGNNVALKDVLRASPAPDFIYLLNPDARARPGAIEALVAFLETQPRAGIAGSRILDEAGEFQHSAFRFPNAWDEFARGIQLRLVDDLLRDRVVPLPPTDRPVRCDWVSGASMLIRYEVLTQIGLWDEGYFLDYEETDFCWAARAHGFECWHVPASEVIHRVAQAKSAAATSPRQPQYWFESRRRFLVKNHGRAYATLADLAWLSGHLMLRARRLLQRRATMLPPRLLSDFVRHSALFRGL